MPRRQRSQELVWEEKFQKYKIYGNSKIYG